jgi:hypothetical protein
LLAGPVPWILLTTLHLQLVREHNPLITIPDDPLDITLWDDVFDQSNWSVVVKPLSFLDSANSGAVWGVASSRWATWHDMAKIMLEDSELSVTCTRYLDGDPLPWDGANLRHGTLVVDIVDKSGVYIGTSNGGNIFSGLARTVAEFAEDFIDSTLNLIEDTEAPEEYFIPGLLLTKPEAPYVVYRTGEGSGIETSRFINSPSKAIQINAGGHSAPGVNECLAGDTLIDGPDGKERIDVLAERGGPFRVWSITPEGKRVAAQATHAFRKGFAELFTYTMDDGRSITVTQDHRFLTPSGFRNAGALQPGDEVSIVDWSQDPSDEPIRQVSDIDYLSGCFPTPTCAIAGIEPVGWDYFYDMTVPGWENYSAVGIWSHNTISASIQAVGDLIGNVVLIGSLGGSIDTLLKPLYEDCCDFDTIIDGPDGKERIGVLAERGGPFRVWSITSDGEKVPATAVFAFKKGATDLFEYTLANGSSIKVTKQHRWLTPDGWQETSQAKIGTLVGVDTDEKFSPVVAMTPLGRRDFYDMHVPGWENYLAEGIWNHNTILAWMSVKSTQRAQNSGWSRYFEYFQDGANKAYTITALMVLRAGFWSTRTVLANEMKVIDGSPFFVSEKNGHYWLDDRIGFNLEQDPTGQIWVDRARKIELKWDAESYPEWVPTIGDPRNLQDPAQRAWGRIEQMVASLRDLGVY